MDVQAASHDLAEWIGLLYCANIFLFSFLFPSRSLALFIGMLWFWSWLQGFSLQSARRSDERGK